jgi:hypothetical protein
MNEGESLLAVGLEYDREYELLYRGIYISEFLFNNELRVRTATHRT